MNAQKDRGCVFRVWCYVGEGRANCSALTVSTTSSLLCDADDEPLKQRAERCVRDNDVFTRHHMRAERVDLRLGDCKHAH